jgi:hypothetical protein
MEKQRRSFSVEWKLYIIQEEINFKTLSGRPFKVVL